MIQNLTDRNTDYKNIFFDLDGTVVDSGQGCINGLKYMFQKIGLTENDEAKIKAFLGPSVKVHLMENYSFEDNQADQAYDFYKEYYLSQGIYENCLYDGIKQTIEAIKNTGKKVYIATLKPQVQAESILERYGMTSLFSGIFGARHDLGIYDKNTLLTRAISKIGDVPDAVMVGDRYYDIISGKHVGFDTAGVLYGYGSRRELIEAGCDHLVDSVSDLYDMLGRKST